MYFDDVVVEFKTFFAFIQVGSGHTVALQRTCKSDYKIFTIDFRNT